MTISSTVQLGLLCLSGFLSGKAMITGHNWLPGRNPTIFPFTMFWLEYIETHCRNRFEWIENGRKYQIPWIRAIFIVRIMQDVFNHFYYSVIPQRKWSHMMRNRGIYVNVWWKKARFRLKHKLRHFLTRETFTWIIRLCLIYWNSESDKLQYFLRS